MSKITIIGMGNVGATIAFKLAADATASEIVLIDIREERALGEAMDIRQGLAFSGSVDIYAGSYEDAKDSDIVIVTSGVGRKDGQSRLDLVKINFDIMMDIMPKITKVCPNSKYVIVSNPVDIMTYAFHKYSGLKENQIIGSGTILDTIRLREKIGEACAVNSKNVHAFVLGEHGNSSFVHWSQASVSGVPVLEYIDRLYDSEMKPQSINIEEVEEYVRKSGAEIIARKGATYYAVSLGVSYICKCILGDTKTPVSVSTYMKGAYGIEDVCLSTVAIIGKNGIEGKILSDLTDEEIQKMRASAKILKDIIRDALPQ